MRLTEDSLKDDFFSFERLSVFVFIFLLVVLLSEDVFRFLLSHAVIFTSAGILYFAIETGVRIKTTWSKELVILSLSMYLVASAIFSTGARKALIFLMFGYIVSFSIMAFITK
jgi:hypothetical protein